MSWWCSVEDNGPNSDAFNHHHQLMVEVGGNSRSRRSLRAFYPLIATALLDRFISSLNSVSRTRWAIRSWDFQVRTTENRSCLPGRGVGVDPSTRAGELRQGRVCLVQDFQCVVL
jgi:hypothetical protein